MTYSTLLVHLDGARLNAHVLDAAAVLAKRFDAKVIGIAACKPMQLGMQDGYMVGELAIVERDIVKDELARAEVEFHGHAGLKAHVLDWRPISALEPVAHVVAKQARCADLVITGIGPVLGDSLTHADSGELILCAGRPVLVVPDANVANDFRNVVVAWTDTRECRRAIMDALPMLHGANRITLAVVSGEADAARSSIEDIRGWLDRHGISVHRIVSQPKGSSAETLALITTECEAELIVAGAYGHSRIREWAFGGVTRDLLLHERCCTLFSH